MYRLNALKVQKVSTKGLHADGGGLYLQVTSASGKSWVYRYTFGGKAREIGLGSSLTTSLSDARAAADECRRMCAKGEDPIEAKRAKAAASNLGRFKGLTFDEAAERYITTHEASWANKAHRQQWRSTLKTYASPLIGHVLVNEITVDHVLSVLRQIWGTKVETASRLRGRIEAILTWAIAAGHRTRPNPAERKALKELLPEASRLKRTKHFPALPFGQVGAFLRDLRTRGGVSVKALEIAILTAARTGEVVGARWTEIDFEHRIWTIPAERTKTRRPHRVPLSAEALELLTSLHKDRESEFVFPGARQGTHLCNTALLHVLDAMGRKDITVHGFRSSFRDWTAEKTDYPHELAEMALGHVLKNKVEAAYRRGDMLEKRRHMMEDWAGFCTRQGELGRVRLLPKARARLEDELATAG